MWSLVTSRGQRVALKQLPCVLGSDREAADVALPHGSINARHARVEEDGEGLRITALEGAPLEVDGFTVEQARLAHGDSLIIGRVTLRLADDQARATPTKAAPPPEVADDGDELVMRGTSATAAAPPRSAAKPRSTGRRPAPAARERQRTTEPLIFHQREAKRGLLHADLSQLSGPVKALLVVLLLALAAGLVWGLSELVAAG